MRAGQDRLDQAVLQIFIDLGAASGGRLLLDDVSAAWGRRQAHEDLIKTVRSMIFGGTLVLAHTSSGAALALTHRGRQQSKFWNHLAAAFEPLPEPVRTAAAPF